MLITPELACDELVARVEAALAVAPPARIVLQLRAKQLHASARARLAARLRAVTRAAGVRLLINGDVALARAVEADGVQLPENGTPVHAARSALPAEVCIGASRHDHEGIQRAAAEGADFATISPIFAVPAKGAALGLARLAELARAHALPLVALGGIRAEHAASVLHAGASGGAVVREVLGQDQPALALRELLSAIDRGRLEIEG